MTYNIQIQCCALVVLLLFAIEFFVRRQESCKRNKAFSSLIIFTFFLTIDDILCTIALTAPGCPHFLRVAAGKTYLILMYQCMMSIMAIAAALTIEREDEKSFKSKLYAACPWIGLGLAVITLFLPISYAAETAHVYIYGPAQYACYFAGVLLMLFFLCFMFFNGKDVPLELKLPIYAYVLIEAVIGIIENAQPGILLTSFGLVIETGLLYFTLQNPYIRELQKQNRRINDMYSKVTKTLVNSVEAKDHYSAGHSLRVAAYSRELAARLGKTEAEQQQIYMAGLLHNVGKIVIPESIVNKEGKLTEEEYEIVKVHTITGSHILSKIYDDKRILFGAKYHHEKYNGTGYPNGLAGEDIPEVARIVGMADAYDAMTSDRSYRSRLAQAVVREEIRRGSGSQFDPAVAQAMLAMIEEDKDFVLHENPPGKKVILVAGDAENTRLIEEVFAQDDDYEVMSARHAQETLKILEYCKIDLLILDLYKGEGSEIYHAIREQYATPILVLTLKKANGAIEDNDLYSVSEYLSKPCSAVMLRECIHSMISTEEMELLSK